MWFIFLLSVSFLVRGIFTQDENAVGPRFRILAPQFVCPRNDDDPEANNAKHFVIQFQMPAGSQSAIEWTVRWKSYAVTQPQRTTLLLWRAVRALEAELNGTPPEPYTYVIRNDELVPGIDYLFNVTAVSPDGARGQSANFSIGYENGKRTLELHEPVMQNKFSMLLLGSETAYAHADYALHSQVTTCRHTDDYHFKWTMKGITDPEEEIDLSNQIGGHLLIPAGTLRGGHNYDIACQLYQTSDGSFISKTGIFVNVERRGLRLQLGSDELVIGEGKPLRVFSHLYNYDDLSPPFVFEWSCTFNGEACLSFESVDDDNIYLPDGFSDVGEYEIGLKAKAEEESAEVSMRVVVVKPSLPVIQVLEPTQRNLNEGTTVELVANVTNISPTCSLAWYFTPPGYLGRNSTNDTCEVCEHGEPLGETLNIYSLDENFLNELADFSNESSTREVRAQLPAASGRARLVASCGCSETFSCEAEGTAYADLTFKLNKSPVPADIMVSPGSGVALETVFRLSTRAVEELDPPVRYSFYYNFGNGTRRVPLASYINHVSHETLLPYIETGVSVGVEVCDVWDACARSSEQLVPTTAADDVGVATRLADTAAAQLRRCEMQQLGSLAVSALISFNNAEQLEALEMFSSSLIKTLKDGAAGACIQNHIQEYQDLIDLLAAAGLFDGEIKE